MAGLVGATRGSDFQRMLPASFLSLALTVCFAEGTAAQVREHPTVVEAYLGMVT